MGITQILVNIFTGIVDKIGYGGICFLMTLESTAAPVPSEAVLPFAGFLMHTGRFSFWPILIWSLVGALLGSLFSYALGLYGLRPLIKRFGKYIFLNEHHLEMTERFFERRGEISVFFCRFIPVVRHFISIPAGAGKMNLVKFTFYTLLGASIWHSILIYTGYYLKDNWDNLQKYFHIIDLFVIVVFVCGIIYLIWQRK